MIYLIRHGQTDWNVEKKTQGHTDIPLNENGRRQAEELAQKLKNIKVDKIITSDLLRAKETAEIINKIFDKNIIVDKRLREIKYGTLEGIPRDALTEEDWYLYNTKPQELKAESRFEVYKRIKSFFDELQDSDDNIIIVTHGGTLRVIFNYVENNYEYDNDKYMTYSKNIDINNLDVFKWDRNSKIIEKYKEG